MWTKLKGWFTKAESDAVSKIVTPEHVEALVDDLFALLRGGVGFTPSPFDDAALKALEDHIDKKQLAQVVYLRLYDLLK